MGSFERPLGRAELPEKARPHDLGRTRATPLLGKGVRPEIVQELPGHATISITLGTHSHVLPGTGGQAASVMDEALQRCDGVPVGVVEAGYRPGLHPCAHVHPANQLIFAVGAVGFEPAP